MKSSDKKKTSEIFEGVGSSLHQSFVEAVEREKEPKKISACCNAEVATANSGLAGETNYYICTKCHNDCDVIAKPKELDRSFGEIQYGMNKINSKLLENSTLVKPKELEWEKDFDEFGILLYQGWKTKMANRDIKDFIKQTLTQQRTELLEEIKKNVKKVLEYHPREDDSQWVKIILEAKSKADIINVNQKLNNLLNKKDE